MFQSPMAEVASCQVLVSNQLANPDGLDCSWCDLTWPQNFLLSH